VADLPKLSEIRGIHDWCTVSKPLVSALDAVLAIHYEANNDAAASPACRECKGAPGVHECGCWRDEQAQTVCGSCAAREGWRISYPCPTVLAVREHIDLEG
jgi:hypothetical protein